MDTGDGAYKISGGSNGGNLILTGLFLMLFIAIVMSFLIHPSALLVIDLVTNGVKTKIYAVAALVLFASANFIAAGIALLQGDKALCNLLVSLAYFAIVAAITVLSSIAFSRLFPKVKLGMLEKFLIGVTTTSGGFFYKSRACGG